MMDLYIDKQLIHTHTHTHTHSTQHTCTHMHTTSQQEFSLPSLTRQ